ncbi:hypothetical protein RFI_19667, partial [Reticulomyxa filosa]
MTQSISEEFWYVQADAIWQFGLPAAPILSDYGGGSDMKLGCPVLVLKVRSEDMLSRFPKSICEVLVEHINSVIEANNSIEKDERIAHLETKTVSMEDIQKNWEITGHFEITGYVPGCEIKSSNQFNIMYQGWLFQEDVQDASISHAMSYPLIGIYDPVGFQIPPKDDV